MLIRNSFDTFQEETTLYQILNHLKRIICQNLQILVVKHVYFHHYLAHFSAKFSTLLILIGWHKATPILSILIGWRSESDLAASLSVIE